MYSFIPPHLQDKYEFNEALDFFQMVQYSEGNKLYEWEGDEINTNPIVLDFNGREELIKSIRDAKSTKYCRFKTITIPTKQCKGLFFSLRNKLMYSKVDPSKKVHTNKLYLFNVHHAYKSPENNRPKPYIAREKKKGIINDLLVDHLNPQVIIYFAKYVMRLLKNTSKEIEKMPQISLNPYMKDSYLPEEFDIYESIIEMAAIILTAERFRSEKALLLSYIEFYKLKHSDPCKALNFLRQMFSNKQGETPSLLFPKIAVKKKKYYDHNSDYIRKSIIAEDENKIEVLVYKSDGSIEHIIHIPNQSGESSPNLADKKENFDNFELKQLPHVSNDSAPSDFTKNIFQSDLIGTKQKVADKKDWGFANKLIKKENQSNGWPNDQSKTKNTDFLNVVKSEQKVADNKDWYYSNQQVKKESQNSFDINKDCFIGQTNSRNPVFLNTVKSEQKVADSKDWFYSNQQVKMESQSSISKSNGWLHDPKKSPNFLTFVKSEHEIEDKNKSLFQFQNSLSPSQNQNSLSGHSENKAMYNYTNIIPEQSQNQWKYQTNYSSESNDDLDKKDRLKKEDQNNFLYFNFNANSNQQHNYAVNESKINNDPVNKSFQNIAENKNSIQNSFLFPNDANSKWNQDNFANNNVTSTIMKADSSNFFGTNKFIEKNENNPNQVQIKSTFKFPDFETNKNETKKQESPILFTFGSNNQLSQNQVQSSHSYYNKMQNDEEKQENSFLFKFKSSDELSQKETKFTIDPSINEPPKDPRNMKDFEPFLFNNGATTRQSKWEVPDKEKSNTIKNDWGLDFDFEEEEEELNELVKNIRNDSHEYNDDPLVSFEIDRLSLSQPSPKITLEEEDEVEVDDDAGDSFINNENDDNDDDDEAGDSFINNENDDDDDGLLIEQKSYRKSKKIGGSELIRLEPPKYFYERFLEMADYSQVFNSIDNLPFFMRNALRDEFYDRKLDKLKAMSENRPTPTHKRKFKVLVLNTKKFFNISNRPCLQKICHGVLRKWRPNANYARNSNANAFLWQ